MGAAFFAVLALGIAAVIGVSAVNDSPSVAREPAPVIPLAAAPPSVPVAETIPEPAQPMADAPSLRAPPSSPNLAFGTGYTVQDSDIGRLAAAVKLGGSAAGGDVGKEVWARETPIAEKLLQGLCDCDQRNWLKHFVETGHEAVNGSEDYPRSVEQLATLRRSNADLAKNQISP